jgi:hypothetical protein
MSIKSITAAALFLVFVGSFVAPQEASACGNPCYGGYSGYQSVQYPIPWYVYYQDPARYARETYTPVIYPTPLYVQTGINPNGSTRYGSNPTQALNYVPTNYSSGNNYYGQQTQYGNNYGNTGYNNGYGNTGFMMTGGSQANSMYGASSGGFMNTSGR